MDIIHRPNVYLKSFGDWTLFSGKNLLSKNASR